MSRKPYIRPMSKTSWYLRDGRYKRYMAREVTCLLIGAYTGVFAMGIWRLAEGREAFTAFMAALHAPGAIMFHLVALAFSIYHSTTWFNVTPQAMPLMKGEDFVPGTLIVGAHYAAWAVASLVILIAVGA
ncbi:MAG: fumarate reductase subunit C [Rhodospirillaceae bacterium]|nr:MAG: fumarate reductase subunit C [Rhodospirillaceae bacterium]